jgi:hypothetical protein
VLFIIGKEYQEKTVKNHTEQANSFSNFKKQNLAYYHEIKACEKLA